MIQYTDTAVQTRQMSSADSAIVFDEVSVSTPGLASGQAGHATPDELVAMGRKLWQRVQESGVAPSDEAGTDKMLAEIQKEFKDFTISFPLVVRWAVQLRKFNPAALHKYLRLHASADLSSRESFLRLQAEYPTMIFREENRSRHDEGAVQRFRSHLIEQLMEEDKLFIQLQKEAEAEAAKQTSVIQSDRRQALYGFIKARLEADK